MGWSPLQKLFRLTQGWISTFWALSSFWLISPWNIYWNHKTLIKTDNLIPDKTAYQKLPIIQSALFQQPRRSSERCLCRPCVMFLSQDPVGFPWISFNRMEREMSHTNPHTSDRACLLSLQTIPTGFSLLWVKPLFSLGLFIGKWVLWILLTSPATEMPEKSGFPLVCLILGKQVEKKKKKKREGEKKKKSRLKSCLERWNSCFRVKDGPVIILTFSICVSRMNLLTLKCFHATYFRTFAFSYFNYLLPWTLFVK